MEVSATERKCLDTTRRKRARMGEASSENGRGLATCRRNEMDRRCGCGTALNLPSQRGDAGYRLMTLNTLLMLGDVAHPRLLACLRLADYSLRVPVNVFDGHPCVVRRVSCFSLQVGLGEKKTTQLRNAQTPIYGD